MKKVNLFAIISLISIVTYSQTSNVINLNSLQFKEIINTKEGVLLDVRTPNEFARGHLKNAGHLNYSSPNFKQKILLIRKDEPIYLYCYSGARSKRAANFLVSNGYTKVYNLQGGLLDWYRNNYSIISNPNAVGGLENRVLLTEFNSVLNSNNIVFVDFYAPWCSPCKKMMPMINELQNEYNSNVKILKVNTDASSQLIKVLQVATVPYLVLYKDGKQVFNHKGFITKVELQKQIQEYIQ